VGDDLDALAEVGCGDAAERGLNIGNSLGAGEIRAAARQGNRSPDDGDSAHSFLEDVQWIGGSGAH
ncbi:MAG: hypothetical protein V3U63_10520, partial [Gemmatimonadota bacterium]